MSGNNENKTQPAADRIKAAALSATKGLSRAQAERAAAAAARNVNAYGQKEEGPSRWQEKREAKRQMYLMSTEKQVRLGERKDLNKPAVSNVNSSAQCQKCYQTGHWTYECKNERVYIARPSRTQQLKNPKLRMKLSVEYDLDDGVGSRIDEEVKVGKGKSQVKKNKRKHRSDSDSGSDSEASVFETDSGSSSVTGSESYSEESSYSSSSDSEEERRRRRRKKKQQQRRKERRRRHSSLSSGSESDSGSGSESDSDDDRSSRRKRRHTSRR